MNLQDLQQENGMLSMIKITQTMVQEIKIVQPLNLKPKSLNLKSLPLFGRTYSSNREYNSNRWWC